MAPLLRFPFLTKVTEEEQIQINQEVLKSQKNFSKGFKQGLSLSLVAYSLYSVANPTFAHAVDSVPKPVDPSSATQCPAPANTGKPGFKVVSDTNKGAYVGGASAICAVALQSGDFWIGFACACVLVIGGIIANRE